MMKVWIDLDELLVVPEFWANYDQKVHGQDSRSKQIKRGQKGEGICDGSLSSSSEITSESKFVCVIWR